MFTKQDLAEAVLEGFQYTALSIYVVCYRRRYGLGTLSKFFGGRDRFVLYLVDHLVPAIIASAWITFGIFIH